MAVYGYARVSTTRQAEEGDSLEVQRRQIEGYAHMRGLVIDRVLIERGVSGSKPLSERPEGAALLKGLVPGDIVITAKLDRMFRSALDALDVLGQLRTSRVSLHMIDLGGDVTDNGISKLVFTILSAVAGAERDRIRERVATVKADQRKRGRFLGGSVPFGFRVTEAGDLVEEAAEQAAIRHMIEMRGAGESFRAIAAEMGEAGHRLSHEAVRGTLARATPRAGDRPKSDTNSAIPTCPP